MLSQDINKFTATGLILDGVVGEDADYTFKCVMVGDVFVGKTSLLERFYNPDLYEDKPPRPAPTVGLTSRTEMLNIQGFKVCVSIWDTGMREFCDGESDRTSRTREVPFPCEDVLS